MRTTGARSHTGSGDRGPESGTTNKVTGVGYLCKGGHGRIRVDGHDVAGVDLGHVALRSGVGFRGARSCSITALLASGARASAAAQVCAAKLPSRESATNSAVRVRVSKRWCDTPRSRACKWMHDVCAAAWRRKLLRLSPARRHWVRGVGRTSRRSSPLVAHQPGRDG